MSAANRRGYLAGISCCLAALAFTGCAGGDDAARDSGARAGASAAAAPTADGAANRVMFIDGDERSELEFTRRGPDALDVREDAQFGDDGKATRRYTFDGAGALLRMHEEKSQTVLSGDRSPAPMRSTLTVTVDGGATSATKTVDGTPGTVQAFEMENVKRRAALIFRLAPR